MKNKRFKAGDGESSEKLRQEILASVFLFQLVKTITNLINIHNSRRNHVL